MKAKKSQKILAYSHDINTCKECQEKIKEKEAQFKQLEQERLYKLERIARVKRKQKQKDREMITR